MNNRTENARLTDEGLPKRCPSWCERDHQQALIEGNPPEDSRIHMSTGLGGFLDDLHNPVRKAYGVDSLSRKGDGTWDLVLEQDEPGIRVVSLWCRSMEFSREEGISKIDQTTLHLTTGEARTLATQLVHLADLGDLS